MNRAVGMVVLLVVAIALACTGDDASERQRVHRTAPTGAGTDRVAHRRLRPGQQPSRRGRRALPRRPIDDLEEQWTADLEALGTLSTVPIVVDDVVYVQGGSGEVAALDLDSGDDALGARSRPGSTSGRSASPSTTTRCTPSTARSACSRSTARPASELWATDVTATDTTGIDIQPVVAGELVLVELGAGEHQRHLRGRRPRRGHALDRDDGRGALGVRHRRGRRPVGQPRGQLRAAVPGTRRPSTSSGVWCTSASPTRRRSPAPPSSRTAPAGPATTSTPTRSSPSTSRPARSSGSTRSPRTTSSTATRCTPSSSTLDDGSDVVVSAGKSGVVVGLDPDDGTVLLDDRGGSPRERRPHRARRSDDRRTRHLRRRAHATRARPTASCTSPW